MTARTHVSEGRRWLVVIGGCESIVSAPDARSALALVVPGHADYSGEQNENSSSCFWHMSTPHVERTPEAAVLVSPWSDADEAVADAAESAHVEPADESPTHSYADSVSHEILSVDVQRHAAYSDAPASIVARVRVRYSFPDAPDSTHGFLFSSNDDESGVVRMTSTVPSGTGLVAVDDPGRFGSFPADPVSWVHAFYA